jgi:hypothetical protein
MDYDKDKGDPKQNYRQGSPFNESDVGVVEDNTPLDRRAQILAAASKPENTSGKKLSDSLLDNLDEGGVLKVKDKGDR